MFFGIYQESCYYVLCVSHSIRKIEWHTLFYSISRKFPLETISTIVALSVLFNSRINETAFGEKRPLLIVTDPFNINPRRDFYVNPLPFHRISSHANDALTTNQDHVPLSPLDRSPLDVTFSHFTLRTRVPGSAPRRANVIGEEERSLSFSLFLSLSRRFTPRHLASRDTKRRYKSAIYHVDCYRISISLLRGGSSRGTRGRRRPMNRNAMCPAALVRDAAASLLRVYVQRRGARTSA